MDWKRGLTRLYVVVATLWVIVSGVVATFIAFEDGMQGVIAGFFIVTLPPAVVFALMRALFWAIDGFSSNGGDA